MTTTILPFTTPRSSPTGTEVAEKRDGLAIAARLLGYTRGSLKVEVYGDDRRTAVNIVETVLRETVRCGQPEIAQRILHRLNMAAAEVLPVALSDELVMLEAELDAAEDIAEIAYLQNPNAITWDTYERKLLKLKGVIEQVIAGGRAQHGRDA